MSFRPRALRAAFAAALIAGSATGSTEIAWGDAANTDPKTGYRVGGYRSPVTSPVEGGKRVALAELDTLIKAGAVLVDVMPARAGYDAKTGRWRLIEKRDDIPSSTWLPNTGEGRLEPRLAAYLATQLRHLTAGNLDRPLVFYCMADCWMSWNAVKRASSLGYRHVNWYAEGTDGWTEVGRGLARAEPPPVPALADTH